MSLENIVSQHVDQNACKIPINKHAKSLFEAWFLPSYIHEDDGPKQQKHHVQAKNNRKIVHAEPPLPTSSQGQDTEPCSLSTGAYTCWRKLCQPLSHPRHKQPQRNLPPLHNQ